MDLEARAIEVGALEGKGFLEPEAQARDGGEGDRIVQGCRGRAEPSDLLHPEDGGETVCAWRAHARQGVPVAREDMRREDADGTVADAQGRGGEALEVVAVQAGGLHRLVGDHVGRFAGELREQAYLTARGVLGTLPRATELQGGHHVLTQWRHELSPFVRWRVVRVRRQTS